MDDTRIRHYREAVIRMQEGHFDTEIPPGPDDETSRLGQALTDLSGKLSRRFQELQKLAEIAAATNSALLLDEILDRVYESFRFFLPYDRMSLAFIDHTGQRVTSRWQRSELKAVQIDRGFSASIEGSSLKTIIETGQPRILNDLEEYMKDHPGSESTRRASLPRR